MSEEIMSDDSTHYEVSLTAGQAFVAFVLLLFSLAASFVFGLMIGRGQVNDRLVVKREPTVINEGAAPSSAPKNEARIVELGVPEEEIVEETTTAAAVEEPKIIEETVTAGPEAITTEAAPQPDETGADAPARVETKVETKAEAKVDAKSPPVEEKKVVSPAAVKVVDKKPAAAPAQPVYAQLLSTGEARTAETLAARLIDAGFTSAYVERSPSSGGMIYRVRVRFGSEEAARGAAERMKAISKTEPWITKQ